MRDETKGFLVLVSLLGSFMMLMWAMNIFAGLFMAMVIVSTVKSTTQDEWKKLGMQIDNRVFTFVILISGSLVIIANTIDTSKTIM